MPLAYSNDKLPFETSQAIDVLTLRGEKEFPEEVDKYVVAVAREVTTERIMTLFLKSDIIDGKPAWRNPVSGAKLSSMVEVLYWNEILRDHLEGADWNHDAQEL